MPKRTNPFQKFVKRVETVLGSAGARIEESAMVRNYASNEDVEVDVLITLDQGRRTLRVCVECRDRGRPQGPDWIRELKTKRDSCRIDKAVAVSAHGFTMPALEEAKTYGIETIWPEQISDEQLRTMLLPPGKLLARVIGVIDFRFQPIVAHPPIDKCDPEQARFVTPLGVSYTTQEVAARIRDFLMTRFLTGPGETIFRDRVI